MLIKNPAVGGNSGGALARAPTPVTWRLDDDCLYCPALNLLWAHRAGDGSPASIVHKTYAREIWRQRTPLGRVLLVLRYLGWPIMVFGTIGVLTFRNGLVIKRRTGKGVLAQARDQLSLAVRHAILPPWYYMFDLYDENNLKRAGDYLHRYETKGGVYQLLRWYVENNANAGLKNKELFASICAEHDLAAAPIVAVVEDGVFRSVPDKPAKSKHTALLPDADLFIKPVQGKGGRGTIRAEFTGDGSYAMSDGATLSRTELVEHLKSLSTKRAYLVQRRLVNHRDIADLCANALSCVRVMTCRNKEGGFEVTNAAFRMALRDDATVDGLHRGGLVAKVDIETGELGLATNLGLNAQFGWVECNPHSGAQIAGRIVPMWPKLRALAERAHGAFPTKVIIGWDIAPTPDGPVIVEGNSSPCVDIIQRVDCEPLGASRFGELLAYHVEAALEAREKEQAA